MPRVKMHSRAMQLVTVPGSWVICHAVVGASLGLADWLSPASAIQMVSPCDS